MLSSLHCSSSLGVFLEVGSEGVAGWRAQTSSRSDGSSVTFTSPQSWNLPPEVFHTFTTDWRFYPVATLLSNLLSTPRPPAPNTLPTSNKFTSSIHFPAASCRASSFSPSFLPSPCLLATNSLSAPSQAFSLIPPTVFFPLSSLPQGGFGQSV